MEKTVERFGLSHRISFQEGDYTKEGINGKYDAVWLSHILHGESPEQCGQIVKKAVAALEPGGLIVIHEFILNDIIKASEDYNLVECGFDPWGATDLATKLFNNHGINMVEMRQGTKTLSEPAKDLLVHIMKGEINHGGHPVLRWCADNLVMVPDANENIRPAKDKATDRIDGMVALIMAWGRAMFAEKQSVGIVLI